MRQKRNKTERRGEDLKYQKNGENWRKRGELQRNEEGRKNMINEEKNFRTRSGKLKNREGEIQRMRRGRNRRTRRGRF